MLQFACDFCANIKGPREAWINGVAVENVGTRAARREVVIDPTWRYERAVLPLAVHFCCVDCKDRYLARLFQQPTPLLEVQSVNVVPGKGRLIHARKKTVTGAARKRVQTQKTRKA